MKHLKPLFSVVVMVALFSSTVYGQNNVAINNTGASPDASAMLDVQSTGKGLLVPRMSTADRNGIPSPATGLIVYDLDFNSFFFYAGSAWIEVVGGFTSLLADNDEDTKIDVEATADEDTIKFTVGGTLMAKMDGKTFHLEAPGDNLFIGLDAGITNTSGFDNTFIGREAGYSNDSGNSNIFIGDLAGYTNLSGDDNVFIGKQAGAFNEDGVKNILIGSFSGHHNQSGIKNIAIGQESLFSNETGNNNIAIGFSALLANVDGDENIAIGDWTLSQSSSASKNTAIGYWALTSNTSGEFNTAVGHEALYSNLNGDHNSAFGRWSLYENISGHSNTGFGVSALYYNTVGDQNTGIGMGALYENTSGNQNVGIGYGANEKNEAGSQNTIIGTWAGGIPSLHDKSGNVFLGYKAGYWEIGDNKLYIENSDSGAPLIYGDFTNGSEVVGINGYLGVGTQSPAHPLHVTKEGADSVQTIVGILQSITSARPVLLFSENGTNSFGSGMSIEYNGAAGFGSDNEMYINLVGGESMVTFENSGNVGIGTTNPSTRLHVEGGTDTGLGGGGYLTLGADDGLNVSFDNNEIMARNNGAIANMYMQANGGKLGIGAVTFDSKVNIRSDAGENPLRARVETATKFLVHSNGGVAIGANATPPANGLKVYGDILMEGDDISSTQTLRLNSSTRIELVVGVNTIIIDPVDGVTITSDDNITFNAGNNIVLNAGNDVLINADRDIKFDANRDVFLDASEDVLLGSGYNFELTSGINFFISGLMIDLDADTELELNAGSIMDINAPGAGSIDIDAGTMVDIDGSFVRIETAGNTISEAAYLGSNVTIPPCSVGCNGTVNTGSSTVLIGH